MTNPTIDELARARAEGALQERTEPRAVHAEYDRKRGVILVQLRSGSWFGFCPSTVPKLRDAGADDLAQVEVGACGEALHWEALDADVSVPGIIFDTLDAPAGGRDGSPAARRRRRPPPPAKTAGKAAGRGSRLTLSPPPAVRMTRRSRKRSQSHEQGPSANGSPVPASRQDGASRLDVVSAKAGSVKS